MGDGIIEYKLNEPEGEDEYYQLSISEEDAEKIYYYYIDLYEEVENAEEIGYDFKYLGTDFLVQYNEESNTFEDTFLFNWTLFGDQPLMTYVVADYDDVVEYEAPVLYNGEEMNLLFAWIVDYDTEIVERVENGEVIQEEVVIEESIDGHYEVYGLRRGIDEVTGMPDKNLYQLEEGSVLTPIYLGETVAGQVGYIEGTPVNVTNENQLVFGELEGSAFQLAFRLVDFSYENHQTDFYPVFKVTE